MTSEILTEAPGTPKYAIKTTKNLSARIQWLRDYYFQGVKRKWNNEFVAFTTGTPWDEQYQETNFYVVPETFAFFKTFRGSMKQTAIQVTLPPDFWKQSIAERHAWFVKEVMLNYLPQEILPGDLVAGGRFNILPSMCLNEQEGKEYLNRVDSPDGARSLAFWIHSRGYGNAGSTGGHLVPDYPRAVCEGWKSIYADLERRYKNLKDEDKQGKKGAQLRAMMTSATMPRELAAKYSRLCLELAGTQKDEPRKNELLSMAANLKSVPWEPAQTFWEGVQSLWLTHMLVMSDEGYPGPGTSFGRIDQYLYPLWQKSLAEGLDREFGKEILKCFWMHCNTAYDAMLRTNGNQGITASFGQLITLSGLGADGKDMTNDLTYAILEVIDDMSPILEPKPNVRLHRATPEKLLDKVVDMVAESQGAPFLLNFDERSMAGMLYQARMSGKENLINESNVFDYAPVGCLENTMAGNDRSGTVDNNIVLYKAVELALTGGYHLLPFVDDMTGKVQPEKRWGPDTGSPDRFKSFEEFWQAFITQLDYVIGKLVEVYNATEFIRSCFAPTPYLSCLVRGCAEKGLDITQGGPELSYTTLEAITYGTTVDSLLAIQYLVFDKKECTLQELVQALKANWQGYEVLQAKALNRAPKYGRDDETADQLALRVMQAWVDNTWKYKTKYTNRQYRPGMLSWNYWIAYSDISPASPDGRQKGHFFSNAICPSNGVDTKGPTANVNSVGNVLGGKDAHGKGHWHEYNNLLPNGASHTITFSPSLVRDPEHKDKFKAFLRGYIENGGTALQINMIDAQLLRDAQQHPETYRHLLVRVTGYNAYFTSIGKELQNEIIARETHRL